MEKCIAHKHNYCTFPQVRYIELIQITWSNKITVFLAAAVTIFTALLERTIIHVTNKVSHLTNSQVFLVKILYCMCAFNLYPTKRFWTSPQ